MSDMIHSTATAQVVAVNHKANVKSVTLTPAAALATVVVRDGTGSGTIKLALQAGASGVSAVWTSNDKEGVLFVAGVHITITGAGALVDVEFEQVT